MAGEMEFEPGTAEVELANNGVGWAQNDAYSLLAVSDDIGSGARAPAPRPRTSPRWA